LGEHTIGKKKNKKIAIGRNNNNLHKTYERLYLLKILFFNIDTCVFSYTEQIHTEKRRLVVCRHAVGNTDVRQRTTIRRA